MRFLLDANVHRDLEQILGRHGHDVATVAGQPFRSAADSNILTIAVQDNRVLITNDRDFGELVFKNGQAHSGVLYLRLGTMLVSEISQRY